MTVLWDWVANGKGRQLQVVRVSSLKGDKSPANRRDLGAGGQGYIAPYAHRACYHPAEKVGVPLHVPCLGTPPVWAGVKAQESSGDKLPLVGAPSSRSGQRTGCALVLPGIALHSNDVTKKPYFIYWGKRGLNHIQQSLGLTLCSGITPGGAQGTYTVWGTEMWSAAYVRGRQVHCPTSFTQRSSLFQVGVGVGEVTPPESLEVIAWSFWERAGWEMCSDTGV